MKQKLILVGNGMAALRFLEQLIERGPARYAVTVFGAEPCAGYNRVLLSALLAGERGREDLITHPDNWYAGHAIDYRKGATIAALDCEQKRVRDHNGRQYAYDKLVIATGSEPFVPPLPGRALAGVYTYRTLADVERMLAACREACHSAYQGAYKDARADAYKDACADLDQKKPRAVVIGGGLLGLEAASGLQARGMAVTVVHLAALLMENQLDALASEKLIASLKGRGIRVITGARTQSIDGGARIESLTLADGRVIRADLAVIATGIRPNIALAQAAGLDCGRGIRVDDGLQTSAADVFALGECAEHRETVYGLVAPLYEQAEVCARYLSGDQAARYRGSLTASGLKVTGIDLYSAGQFQEDERCQVITLRDDEQGIYRKLIIRANALVGVLLYGDISGALWYQELIRSSADIAPYKDFLMFGPDYAPAAPESPALVAVA